MVEENLSSIYVRFATSEKIDHIFPGESWTAGSLNVVVLWSLNCIICNGDCARYEVKSICISIQYGAEKLSHLLYLNPFYMEGRGEIDFESTDEWRVD